jgi:AraC-like DNA-binding protein
LQSFKIEAMDPLSDVLSVLKVRVYAARGFEAGDDWSVAFGPSEGIKLFAVISGEGWLAFDEVQAPIRIRAGDCLLLPNGCPYRIASDISLPSVDGDVIVRALLPNEKARFGRGSDCFGLAGHFNMAGENADLLLSMLPQAVHIQQDSDKQVLRWCLERMMKEFDDPQPGASLATQQLGTLMLVQILRTYLTSRVEGTVGWMFALTDRRVGIALQAMHEVPGHPWTLNALAQHAGMSRTGFAVRFKELVGLAPLSYLARWRMSLAKERILNSPDPIGVIAVQMGYQSESAFSTAFRRLVGCAPRRYAHFLKAQSVTK